jgi:hypothetical protein
MFTICILPFLLKCGFDGPFRCWFFYRLVSIARQFLLQHASRYVAIIVVYYWTLRSVS